jgi:hypothetical protein
MVLVEANASNGTCRVLGDGNIETARDWPEQVQRRLGGQDGIEQFAAVDGDLRRQHDASHCRLEYHRDLVRHFQ